MGLPTPNQSLKSSHMFGNLTQVSRILGKVCGLVVLVTSPRSQEYWAKFCGLVILVTSPRSQEYWAKFCGMVVLVTSPRSQEHIYIYILHKFRLGQSQPIVSNPTCGIKSRSFCFLIY